MPGDRSLFFYSELLSHLARELQPRELLWHTAGERELAPVAGEILALPVRKLDPADPLPASPVADSLAVSDRFLQFLGEDEIERHLSVVAAHARHHVFFIETTFSQEVAPDGGNRHRSIADGAWWLAKIRAVFPCALHLPTPVSKACVITTWGPGADVLDAIVRLKTAEDKAEKISGRIRRAKNAVTRVFRRPLSEKRILAELRDKQVAIVGNAQSLAERDYGEQIDAADIIIRCNRGPIIHTHSHGARTDWLCTSLPLARQEVRKRGVKRILWMNRTKKPSRMIPRWMVKSGILYLHPVRRHRQLTQRIGAPPSTGVMGIELVARAACRSLDIYGFDFSVSKSYSNLSNEPSRTHDFDLERDYVRRLVDGDDRLRIHY